MNEDKKQKFEVYLLDVFLDESGWQENERFYLGTLEVEPAVGAGLRRVDIPGGYEELQIPGLHRAPDQRPGHHRPPDGLC